MRFRSTGILPFMLLAGSTATVLAAPTVSNGTISFPSSDYWQVQSIAPYVSVCEGEALESCSVDEGTYNVINLTTGERFENISVPAGSAPVVNGNIISWQGEGWWQVQIIEPYNTVCEGAMLRACAVEPGTYNVINHMTGERYENIAVRGSDQTITVQGNVISWQGDDYWQVQTVNPFITVCEGSLINRCEVESGLYNIINLTTGQRFEKIAIGHTSDTSTPEDQTFALTVLHINDHHSHLQEDDTTLLIDGVETDVIYGGFPRVTSKMNALADAADHAVLKLHAGDAITGTLFYTLFRGEADAALMNTVCFDAFALGNHEFDDGDAGLADFLTTLNNGSCQTDVLAANVVPEVGVSPLALNSASDFLKPFTIKELNGEQIGIIGIDIAFKTKNSSNPDETTVFPDELTTAQRYIDELEEAGVDKIVLLTHYQYQNDIDLAQSLSGVDVIVGGDSHSLLGEGFSTLGLEPQGPYPTVINNADGNPVCIVQAWQYSLVVGELNVLFDNNGDVLQCGGTPHLLLGDTFEREGADGSTVTLSGSALNEVIASIEATPELSIVQPDATASALVQGYAEQTDVLSENIIGSAADDLCLERIPGQGRSRLCDTSATAEKGSDISNLVALAFLTQSNTSDIALQNGGGVRIDIPAGPITIGDAYTLLPFSNTLLEIQMTGQQIVNTLEDALDFALNPEGSTGAYPYASGLRWTIDARQPKGERFSAVEVKLRGDTEWSPIEPARIYKVVTNDFIGGGRDGYTTLGEIESDLKVNTFLDYAQSFVDYVQSVGTVTRLPDSEYSTQQFIGLTD